MIPFIFSFFIKSSYNPIISFLNINNILLLNHSKNNICISSLSPLKINYNSFSLYDDYNYSSSFLFHNKNHIIINHNFYDHLNNFYNYSFIINTQKININKYKLNINVNYNNQMTINDFIYQKLIEKQIKRCFYFNNHKKIHLLFKNYLD